MVFSSISAQKTIKLWGEKPDNYKKQNVSLTIYEPQNNSNGVGIIFLPGGSYCYLGVKYEGTKPAEQFSKDGFTAFILEYRTGIKGNRYPSGLEDLQMAINYIKQNYNLDYLGTCGFSAGGHLSLNYAFKWDTLYNNNLKKYKTDFAISLYPVVTMDEPYCHTRSRRNLLGENQNDINLRNTVSLEKIINNQAPPLFIINCVDDPIVKYQNSIILSDSLKSKNINHYYKLYQVGGHGFGVSPERIKNNDKSACYWYKDFYIWLEKLYAIKLN